MHESLVGADRIEVREVLLHDPHVIDLRVGVQRPVGVAVDEIGHPQVPPQPQVASVRQVLAEDAARITVWIRLNFVIALFRTDFVLSRSSEVEKISESNPSSCKEELNITEFES